MQKRRHTESKQTRRDQRHRDASPYDRRALRIVAPDPNDRSHDCAARQPEKQRCGQFPPQVLEKPAPRQRTDPQRLDREGHRLHAHALIEPEHHCEKKGDDQAAGECRFKRAREHRASCAGGHGKR